MDDYNPWFDSLPSPGRCDFTKQTHGIHCTMEVLGLGVLELFIPYSMAEGRLRIAQIGLPAPRRG